MPPSNGSGGVSVSNGLEFDGDEVGSDSAVRRAGTGEGGAVSAEEASGHFYVGFGEGLTTKSPVVYFAKTKDTVGGDCSALINAYQASYVGIGSFEPWVRVACSRTSYCPAVLSGERPPSSLWHEGEYGTPTTTTTSLTFFTTCLPGCAPCRSTMVRSLLAWFPTPSARWRASLELCIGQH